MGGVYQFRRALLQNRLVERPVATNNDRRGDGSDAQSVG
jgi:hypothetical protein